ncbi:nucleotidyltransferase [Brevibacillus sp. NSP2.1]|uniref:cyclic GMP-AMP synthase DncV-like nucleotidyltransferase n=1 Tax=Brevibacillus sp. NSP2.1 TaxID=3003229 RepID=UPI000419342A|nr:hypothetical protein [Brevibacillus sp. NSP2.1]QHZ58422.1 nucleotidyltransferase [Brevibacillus sp. NSP2.1]
MYNLSSKFNTFYNDHVVLSRDEQNNLRDKKDLNISRLKSGLQEYNTENETSYSVVEIIEQGSMAMSTITQNDQSEYDIDVAIVFDKDSIPERTTSVKNIVVDALKRKCKQFKTEPEALTNAVRVEYADGYHVDFAIYRRYKNEEDEYEYEHCGSQWRLRNPRSITDWFNTKNTESDGNIRKVVRLLKMFCKSRSGWLMPGGLVQSVLVEECIQSKDRLDETFYYTIKEIRDRLNTDKSVNNPTDTSTSLLLTAKDEQKVKNLSVRLTNYIKKLDVLFEDECTEDQAISAWNDFFDHSYWGGLVTETAESRSLAKSASSQYRVDIVAVVEWKPSIRINLKTIGGRVPKNRTIYFNAVPNFHDFDAVLWEVVNTGDECGLDKGHTQTGLNVQETTLYRGTHKMICRVYRRGTLLCSDEVKVVIK